MLRRGDPALRFRRVLAGLWVGAVGLLLVVLALRLRPQPYGLPNTRGWGDPGVPGSEAGRQFALSEIVVLRAGGVRVRVHRQAAANFRGFLDALADTGYQIRQVDTGGFNHRYNVNNPDVLSEHSWGTAVDVNWTTNPNRPDCRLITDLPKGVKQLAKRWGLRWGGTFSCPKDPMHLEVRGTPADAARVATATLNR